MKTRNGFVSNSSSSSFVCSVCGVTESGMDACPSDFEMSNCVNGHCFCNSHTENFPKPTPQQMREFIKNDINENEWKSKDAKQRELKRLDEIDDDYLEDYYHEEYSHDALESECPVCSFTDLNSDDGFLYLKKKFDLTDAKVLDDIKKQFKSYTEFEKYIRPPKK